MRPESQSSKRFIGAAEKEAQALELRKTGMSYRRIAEAMGLCNRQKAERIIKRALKNVVTPGVEALRTLENERYDEAMVAIWPRVQKGDLESLHGFLRLSERRCRLLGLDAPAKLAPTTPDGLSPYRLEAMTPEETVQTYREALERALTHDA